MSDIFTETRDKIAAAREKQLAKLTAENERLRAALEKGIRLYETYGLVAQSSECGEWINTARAALEK